MAASRATTASAAPTGYASTGRTRGTRGEDQGRPGGLGGLSPDAGKFEKSGKF